RCICFLRIRPTPRATPFPYPPPFRSSNLVFEVLQAKIEKNCTFFFFTDFVYQYTCINTFFFFFFSDFFYLYTSINTFFFFFFTDFVYQYTCINTFFFSFFNFFKWYRPKEKKFPWHSWSPRPLI